MKKILTLCLIHEPDRILLGMKKRGFGAGRWNGFGGKVEQGETIEEAARREVREEAGVEVGDVEKRGLLEFIFPDTSVLEVHVFSARHYTGEPKESDEMLPQWFSLAAIPYEAMWSDDPLWLPLFLKGKRFEGRFHFDEHQNVREHELRTI